MLEGSKLHFRSNGKLLITSEYLVLDGAEALALPTKKGQTLTVEKVRDNNIQWKSFSVDGSVWFECELDNNFEIISSTDTSVANTLTVFLKVSAMMNPNFVVETKGVDVETHLEFDQSWGLGSSSTLISNIAQWAKVDPFLLQQETFPGSGYDIACALSKSPIIYRIYNKEVSYLTTNFTPSFYDQIFFIHLNKKQNSRDGINKYKESKSDISSAVKTASSFADKFNNCRDLGEFRKLMAQHELLISEIIGEVPVKQKLFPDFKGSIKSLGAWGGDFVMAVGHNTESYFKSKGYKTIIPFKEMVLS
ncbi:MAG: GHMP kinase [Flavobacteriales bacterium]|nr:GHMP kinase [Flavobacteriales bacterium]